MKLTVKEAARLMGASPAFVRRGLQQGSLPIGAAVVGETGKWSFWIDHARLANYVRKDPEKLMRLVTIWRAEGEEEDE